MSSEGEVFLETDFLGNLQYDKQDFSEFLSNLEKSSGVLPEIYIKIDYSFKLLSIKYIDALTGDFISLNHSKWKNNGAFDEEKTLEIFNKLKEKHDPNHSVKKRLKWVINNSERVFETRISPTEDKSFLIILKDITEKIKIEENLLKLNKALDSTGDIVLTTDKEGIITYVNPAFLKLYGYDENEIIGKVTPRILKSNLITAEQYKRFWDTLISQNSVKLEIINKTKDGREVYIESTADPIINEDGEIIGFLEIQRDITQRKISETALRQSELRFRSVWEKSFDGMRLTDKNGKIVSVNKAFCDLTGMAEHELLDKPFIVVYKLTDKEREEKINEYINLFSDRKLVNFRWNNFVLHNGKSVFFNVSSSFIDSAGETLMLAIFRDVTKYKKSQDELRNAERLAAIGTMAAYLSHEIKNPLATIKNYVEILFENENVTEDIRDQLKIIHDTVKRLNKLLTDVLQYARSEELIEVEIEIETIVNNVLESLKRRIKSGNITVKNQVKDIIISGDYMSMISVFTNLIENSIEAINGSGEIILSGRKNKVYNSVTIQDNGCGVETNKKIFEPFVTTKSSGTGLGLAIVDKIMKFHNGTIELISSKPGPTVFELKFFNKGTNGKDSDN